MPDSPGLESLSPSLLLAAAAEPEEMPRPVLGKCHRFPADWGWLLLGFLFGDGLGHRVLDIRPWLLPRWPLGRQQPGRGVRAAHTRELGVFQPALHLAGDAPGSGDLCLTSKHTRPLPALNSARLLPGVLRR